MKVHNFRNVISAFALCATILAVAHSGTAQAADPVKGKALYATHCAGCHGVQGEGAPGMPDFKRSHALMQPEKALLNTIKLGKGIMPGFNGLLEDPQISDLIAHLRMLP